MRIDAPIHDQAERDLLEEPRQPQPPHSIIRLALPAIVVILVSLIPYLNKAFTNDDPLFLLSAQQILKDPLQPMSYPVCWMSNETCVHSAANLGPLGRQALMGYLLVPVILLGGSEWLAHLLQIVLACLAIIAVARLALRLGFDREQASLSALLVAAIPPLLVMASSALPDMLAIALGFNGFERLLAWKGEHRRRDAVLAALLLGFAPFARPHLTLLLPLGALWLIKDFRFPALWRQIRSQAWLWTPIITAGCILLMLLQLTRDRGPALDAYDAMVSWGNMPRNLLSYLQYLAYPIPFAAAWLGLRWRRKPWLLIAPALVVAILHFLTDPGATLLQRWPFIASAYGLVALINLLGYCWLRPDWTNRLLSLWVLLPVPVVIYTHMPMKYMIGIMPAVVLLLLRGMDDLPRFRAVAICRGVIVISLACSWVLLRADADFANSGRRAARELIAPRVAAGEKVWYGGNMGFYWYAQQAGAAVSKPGEPGPKPGELLAVAWIELGASTLKRFPDRELIDSRHYKLPYGRTMGYGAALYTNSAGDAPWIWKPEATNDYQLWRVK